MSSGRDLTRHQRGIVKRYYLNRGSIVLDRLQSLVSELYLASGSEADKLWARADKALRSIECQPPLPASRIDKILADRDPAALAQLVTEMQARAT